MVDRERLVYVDWLRLLALGGVFLIHVCEVFNPWDTWHITNPDRSRILGEIVVLLAPWIMPLFMVLAGVSAWFSLQRRTNRVYIRERVMRLLVPLVIGTLILVPPQVYAERRLRGQFSGSFFAFYPHFFEGIYPRGNFSWHHLWFLGHLFVYSIIALPIFRYWQHSAGQRQLARFARLAGGQLGLFWLALPLVLERHFLWSAFPERHMLTSDWSNHALLFVAYLYGFVLAGMPWLGAVVDTAWPSAAWFAGILSVSLMSFAWLGVIPDNIPPAYSPGYLAFWSLYAIAAWTWLVAVLGAGRRFLRRDTTVLAYGREGMYPAYLLHQPVIVGFAYWIVQWRVPLVLKFLTLLILSGIVTFAGVVLMQQKLFWRRPLLHRAV